MWRWTPVDIQIVALQLGDNNGSTYHHIVSRLHGSTILDVTNSITQGREPPHENPKFMASSYNAHDRIWTTSNNVLSPKNWAVLLADNVPSSIRNNISIRCSAPAGYSLIHQYKRRCASGHSTGSVLAVPSIRQLSQSTYTDIDAAITAFFLSIS